MSRAKQKNIVLIVLLKHLVHYRIKDGKYYDNIEINLPTFEKIADILDDTLGFGDSEYFSTWCGWFGDDILHNRPEPKTLMKWIALINPLYPNQKMFRDFKEFSKFYSNHEIVKEYNDNTKTYTNGKDLPIIRNWVKNLIESGSYKDYKPEEPEESTSEQDDSQLKDERSHENSVNQELDMLNFQQLKKLSRDAISRTLGAGYFEAKYISKLYVERDVPREKFIGFLEQDEKKCFAITGKAGKGKTNLFCNLSETLSNEHPNDIVVLLNSPEIDFTNSSTKLESYVECFFNDSGGFNVRFDQITDCIKNQSKDSKLVIFIDAINELEGDNSFENFNNALKNFAEKYLMSKSPVYLAVSCRTDFWEIFCSKPWIDNAIYERDGAPQYSSSYELTTFNDKEFKTAKKEYFNRYKLVGSLVGEAAEICHDPIMLRFFCVAYTKRQSDKERLSKVPIQHIEEVAHLRRKEVFDEFVKNAIPRLQKKASKLIGNISIEDDPEALYEHTTKYLLSMANKMFEKGETFITSAEIKEVAEKIGHPDAKYNQSIILKRSSQSVAFAFRDEGIIIGKRNNNTYDFVFESYFEYTLGRYFALEHWKQITKKHSGLEKRQVILADFRSLLGRHTELMKENFTNLLSSLEFAILVTEEDDFYVDMSDIFIDLINILLSEENQRAKSVAFATIRDTKLLNKEDIIDDHDKKTLIKLYRTLYDNTKNVDFVIMWELENSIVKMAARDVDLAIVQMTDWAINGDKIQPMYAIQILTRICTEYTTHANKVLNVFAELSASKQYQNNFWLARPLILGAWEIAVRRPTAYADIDKLRKIVVSLYENRDSPAAIKGLALSVLPYLSAHSAGMLNEVKKYVENETYEWAIWNLIYELKYWWAFSNCDFKWLLDILELCHKKFSKAKINHINYVIISTLEHNRKKALINTNLSVQFDKNRCDELLKVIKDSKETKYFPDKFDGSVVSGNVNNSKAIIVYSPYFLEPSLNNHVECRERLEAILDKIQKYGKDICWVNPLSYDESTIDVYNVHNKTVDKHFDGSQWVNYPKDIKDAYEFSKKRTDEDIIFQTSKNDFRYESYDVALIAVSAAITATKYLKDNPNIKVAWSLGRPPGHLANNKICIFNNVALAAKSALDSGVKKILIIDCDAHHGKHTADVFIESEEVIYCSIHVDGPYTKGDGAITRVGKGKGEGYNINIVYPDNMGDDGYFAIVNRVIKPLIADFQPEMIFISAGFDGHFEDFLTPTCKLTEDAFRYLSRCIKEAMEQNDRLQVCGVLEGGYGLDSWSNSFIHMLNILSGLGVSEDEIGNTQHDEDIQVDKKAILKVNQNIDLLIEQLLKVKNKRKGDYKLFNDITTWM